MEGIEKSMSAWARDFLILEQRDVRVKWNDDACVSESITFCQTMDWTCAYMVFVRAAKFAEHAF